MADSGILSNAGILDEIAEEDEGDQVSISNFCCVILFANWTYGLIYSG